MLSTGLGLVYTTGSSYLHSSIGLLQMLPVLSDFGVDACLPCGTTLVGENVVLSAWE